MSREQAIIIIDSLLSMSDFLSAELVAALQIALNDMMLISQSPERLKAVLEVISANDGGRWSY